MATMKMMKDTEACCGKCCFWRNRRSVMVGENAMKEYGECRRNPPSTNGHEVYFPRTEASVWCGEFRK